VLHRWLGVNNSSTDTFEVVGRRAANEQFSYFESNCLELVSCNTCCEREVHAPLT